MLFFMIIIFEWVDFVLVSQFLMMVFGVMEVLYINGVVGVFDNFVYLLIWFDMLISMQ